MPDHATSEQFHSEFKTALDVERLPSRKFATNALVLSCATLAYNILRWIGQNGLLGPRMPRRRHPASTGACAPRCRSCCTSPRT